MDNNMESKIVIGDKLQHLLTINGLNTASLNKETSIDESTLQDYLNNVKSPTLEDAVQLAKFFNASLDYMIGTSDFILDTWDYDFLAEFLQFSSIKIREHFEDRQNIKVHDRDELDTVLFGLLTYITLSRLGRSFEDLSDDEISIMKASYTEIISIFNSCITMSNADIEKFDSSEKLILESWKEREKRNILTLAAMNDWEIARVVSELDKINQLKLEDHTSLHQALANIYEAPWEDQSHLKSITTGIKQLDDMTGGFQGGEVTILAARPSMGKTDVMLHFAKMAGWAGYLPLVFSLEMPERPITKRLIASTGGFNRSKMRDPKRMLSPRQKDKWSDVIGNLNETHIQIFDGAGQSIAQIRAKTRKLMNQFPCKKPIVFIDYLTLIQASQSYGGNAHQQVTEISKALKNMTKDFDCPVVCLAQLNRSVETRAIKRPMMSDIRESGSVEQDADVILFLYREAYYDKETQDHSLEIIVSKNRNGQVGSINVKYNEYTGAIEDRKEQKAV